VRPWIIGIAEGRAPRIIEAGFSTSHIDGDIRMGIKLIYRKK
jgi:hypothetical protein